jgi:hypothetical protein
MINLFNKDLEEFNSSLSPLKGDSKYYGRYNRGGMMG